MKADTRCSRQPVMPVPVGDIPSTAVFASLCTSFTRSMWLFTRRTSFDSGPFLPIVDRPPSISPANLIKFWMLFKTCINTLFMIPVANNHEPDEVGKEEGRDGGQWRLTDPLRIFLLLALVLRVLIVFLLAVAVVVGQRFDVVERRHGG
jgi:hypothetical protein